MVYFIQETSGQDRFVKVGYTAAGRSPYARLKSLQGGNPRQLAVEAALVNGGPVIEKEIHRRLREQRAVGEWFRRSAALEELMRWARLHSRATHDEAMNAIEGILELDEPRQPHKQRAPRRRGPSKSNVDLELTIRRIGGTVPVADNQTKEAT